MNEQPQQDTFARAEDIIRESKKVSDGLFEKAQAYNNAITLAGFGGLFALLAATKDIIPTIWLSVSAILITISLFIYIIIIVVSIYTSHKAMTISGEKQLIAAIKLQKSINADTIDLEKTLHKFKKHYKIYQISIIAMFIISLIAGLIMIFFYAKDVLYIFA